MRKISLLLLISLALGITFLASARQEEDLCTEELDENEECYEICEVYDELGYLIGFIETDC